jgi:hypothetical protein
VYVKSNTLNRVQQIAASTHKIIMRVDFWIGFLEEISWFPNIETLILGKYKTITSNQKDISFELRQNNLRKPSWRAHTKP